MLDKNAEDAQQFQYIPLVSGQYYEEEETEEAQLDDPSDSDITVIRRKPATKKRNITETVLRAPVLTDDHYMRFPAVIPGFALKSKRWGYFQVGDAFLKPIEWNKTAFMTLQMEGYKRDLIKSLLDGHKGTSSGFDDVVSGKGQGLIFLLYGPPGLGKTLTAGM